METILLLISKDRDRQLLEDYLADKYHIVASDHIDVLNTAFDLCLLDGIYLKRLRDSLQVRRESEKGVFLPILLVTAKQDIGMLTSRIWQIIDDVISTPIEKGELHARIEVLLRARRLSLELRAVQDAELQRSRRALSESEELQKAIVACSPLATYSLDKKGNVLSWNPAAEAMFGWQAREVIGKPLPIVPAEKQSEFQSLMRRILEGESISGMELVRQRKDGSFLECSLSGAPIRDSQGGIVGIMATMEDITERKRTERALMESESRFRSLFKNNHAVMLLIDPGDGAIVDANPAACSYYGWSKDQITRMNIADINTLSPEQIHEEMNRAKTQQRHHFEFRHRLADGTVRDVEVYSGPIHVSGRVLLYSLVFDVTERKAAEQARLASEARFRLLVENAPDGVFVQTQGRFAYLNRAATRIFGGREAGELLGMPIVDYFHPDCREFIREQIQLLNRDKIPVPMHHVTVLHKDGTAVDIEASAVPMHYEGHDGALVFVRDISERIKSEKQRQELEAQLHQAQKMESIGRLAGGVAHDYNNILSVILGFTELALRKVKPGDPLRDDLNKIYAAAERSRDITRKLLTFARKEIIAPKVLDLNVTVESMLKILRKLIGEDIELTWRPGVHLWPVKMDPSQVDQILANLCVNARDAIADVGKITIETGNVSFDQDYCNRHAGFSPGDFVFLAVSDDGCGMDAATLENIFEPFFTTKGVGKGTGLGLATVYGIVKQNDGFINVYSEPGHGTTFKIYFPRATGDITENRPADAEKIPEGKGETILVVEDDASILAYVEELLTSINYKVLKAETPSDALQKARTHATELSLLMTDVIMPEMNGRELAQQLLTICPKIKCLYMSGYTADIIAQRGVLTTGIQFIQKPFSARELAVKVRAALEHSQKI
ncbi:PAS domain S-box protein [Desulfosoma caldarium]|uniref:histidine kinase n=1 Tax=Desulfosoma caldarium TaxID=610254 RepID=A0A3N1UTX9_9BACT|nr:PAS domain S-box protein [Desulfosoma caldarium]ROQ93613.1 PAS domain S-box-containing protein [Desulfosoma caldarium]